MNTWTRQPDGTYQLLGWTIARASFAGSGQSRPFAHVNTKAYSAWMVTDPDGFYRTGSATLSGAKANADRQIELRAGLS